MFFNFVAIKQNSTSEFVIHWKLFHPVVESATYIKVLIQEPSYGSCSRQQTAI